VNIGVGLGLSLQRRGGGVALTELAFLQANFTGTPVTHLYSAAFDGGSNVGSTGGVVDTLDGALGTEPQIVFAGTARPAWDAVNLHMTFDGTDDFGTTVAHASFANDVASTIALVASPSFDNGDYIGGKYTAGRFMLVGVSGGGIIQGDFTGGLAASGVAVSANRRLILVSKDALDPTNLKGEVPDVAAGTNTAVPIGAGTNPFVLGSFAAGSGAHIAMVFRAVLLLNRAYTADDKTVLKNWASTYHSYVAAA
jgi:hypothetical protein